MDRWTVEKANDWYVAQPWIVGCNYIPSTAVNQLEFWQADTFDPGTIEKELGWAAGLGMNTVRVYLHDLAWDIDPGGFKSRIERFLTIAAGKGIRVIPVIFDDCWHDEAKPGPQPAPIPGVHNSRWVQSPGVHLVNDPATWGRLEEYVTDLVRSFAGDERVLMWDLYNEPGNSGQEEKSLPLLCKVFEWVRAASPTQPLTAGLWFPNPCLDTFQTMASDIITFHNYFEPETVSATIAELRHHKRPLICTEWLRRPGSDVATCLPVFQRERVGCISWGLVAGKTQTNYSWISPEGSPEPEVWFHDLLHNDGSPYDPAEAEVFRQLTSKGVAQPSG